MAWWLVQHLATVTALIAVLHITSRLFSLGPVTRHALWVIVLIKFVTPPLVTWPWTVDGAARPPATTLSSLTTADASSPTLMAGVSPELPTIASPSSIDTPQRTLMPAWTTTILVVWIGGSVAFGLVQLARTLRLARLVRRSTATSVEALERLAADAAVTLGVRAVPVKGAFGRRWSNTRRSQARLASVAGPRRST